MRYHDLCQLYQKLESTTKRLEKTHYIAEFLKKTSVDDLPIITLLLQGNVFPSWDERKVGMAAKLVLKAINVATGVEKSRLEKEWKRTGDLGDTAEHFITKKAQATLFAQELSVKKVFDNLRKLAELVGPGTVDRKIKLVAELLTSAKPLEAKYIVRTLLEELRVGVGAGTLRDAIAWAYLKEVVKVKYDKEANELIIAENMRDKYNEMIETVQSAFDVCNDFAVVAKVAKTKGVKGLLTVSLQVGTPIKVMLFQKAKDIDEAFERVGRPAAFEYKYDGFRIQVHKKDKDIILFTRRLENVTQQFPEVVRYIRERVKGKSFILDTEAVGFDPKTKKYLPFQNISQRIKRKYDIDKMAKDFPIELNVFDVVYFEGKNLMKEPFKKRRQLIEKIVQPEKRKIVVARELVTSDAKEADSFYKEAVAEGEEGTMAKNLEGIYKPGSRVGYGVKVKPVMETLDLVVVAADWGEGKRAKWLSSYTIACRDEETGELLEVGKVGTGFKELKTEKGVTFAQMTEMLKPLIKKEKGKTVFVRPKIVIELRYEEIQKSPTYSSGYALRFPRLVKLREDKAVDEISTIAMIKALYKEQKK